MVKGQLFLFFAVVLALAPSVYQSQQHQSPSVSGCVEKGLYRQTPVESTAVALAKEHIGFSLVLRQVDDKPANRTAREFQVHLAGQPTIRPDDESRVPRISCKSLGRWHKAVHLVTGNWNVDELYDYKPDDEEADAQHLRLQRGNEDNAEWVRQDRPNA